MNLAISISLGVAMCLAQGNWARCGTQTAAPATQPATSPTMLDRADSAGKAVGETAAHVGSAAAEAAGNVLQKSGMKTGEAVGSGLTNLAAGLAKGVDSAIPDRAQNIPLVLSQELQNYGVAVTRRQCRLGTYRAYFVNKQPFKGTVVLKAIDASGQEIARGRQNVTFADDDGQEIEFNMGVNAPLDKAASYELSLRQTPSTQAAGAASGQLPPVEAPARKRQ